MKTLNCMRSIPLVTLVLVVMMAVPAMSMAAQPPVNLGTTASFAVLAGTTITNTGPTTITGDIGLHPGTQFAGRADVTVTGAVHLGDAVALQAKNDLVNAYDDAAGRTPVTTIPTELGGTTLKPGVYVSTSGTFQITGTLTLDAQGDPNAVFIFKTTSTLITAPNSSVSPINGARFCRVFWKVGSSATLGTGSQFVGHIFALTSIAAQTGATVQGQLLARNGEVTLDTNTITNGICTPTTPVKPKVTLALSGLKNGVVMLGKGVTAKGKVTPTSLAGSQVKITVQRKSGGKWIKVKSVMRTIRTNGTYSWKYTPAKSGTYRMRTTIAKTSTNASAASKWHGFKAVFPSLTG
jgi:Ice-binding-like